MMVRNLSGAVDFTVLEAMTGGLSEVTLEVLDLYTQQAALWAPLLNTAHEGWKDALHTLRGASAGIGATALANACAEAESYATADAEPAIERVIFALDRTLSDVAIYRHAILIHSLRR
jgi:HPt (histidine-containing phosphotransfer) domain-containing protein